MSWGDDFLASNWGVPMYLRLELLMVGPSGRLGTVIEGLFIRLPGG